MVQLIKHRCALPHCSDMHAGVLTNLYYYPKALIVLPEHTSKDQANRSNFMDRKFFRTITKFTSKRLFHTSIFYFAQFSGFSNQIRKTVHVKTIVPSPHDINEYPDSVDFFYNLRSIANAQNSSTANQFPVSDIFYNTSLAFHLSLTFITHTDLA